MAKKKAEKSSVTDEELFKAIDQMQKDFAKVNIQAKKQLKNFGVSGKSLKKYMNTYQNFTEEEWKLLKSLRKEASHFKKDMWDALGYDVAAKKKKLQEEKRKKEEEKKKKERKKKAKIKAKKAKSKQDVKSKKRRKKMVGFKKGWMKMG